MEEYWLSGTSQRNFELGRKIDPYMEREFSQDPYQKRILKEIQYYDCFFVDFIWQSYQLVSITEATGEYTYDTSVKFEGTRINPNETFPHCFHVNSILTPIGDKLLGIGQLVLNLKFITAKQRAENWRLAFRNTITEIRNREDFELIQ